MFMSFSSNDSSSEALRCTINEAKNEGYFFNIHYSESIYKVPPSQIEIFSNNIQFCTDEKEHTLEYDKFYVQVLPSSKIINIITKPSTTWIGLSFLLPITISYALYELKAEIGDILDVSPDAVIGFATAILFLSYVTQIVSTLFW